MSLRSQFTQLLEKGRTNEAGTHGLDPAIGPAIRQVLTTPEEMISHEMATCDQEKRQASDEVEQLAPKAGGR